MYIEHTLEYHILEPPPHGPRTDSLIASHARVSRDCVSTNHREALAVTHVT